MEGGGLQLHAGDEDVEPYSEEEEEEEEDEGCYSSAPKEEEEAELLVREEKEEEEELLAGEAAPEEAQLAKFRLEMDAWMAEHQYSLRSIVQRMEELVGTDLPLRGARSELRVATSRTTGIPARGVRTASTEVDRDLSAIKSKSSMGSAPSRRAFESSSWGTDLGTARGSLAKDYLDTVRGALGSNRVGGQKSSGLFSPVNEIKDLKRRTTHNFGSGQDRSSTNMRESAYQVVHGAWDGWKDLNRDNWRAKFRKFIESQAFQAVSAIMILLNTIFVGIETQYQAQTGQAHRGMQDLMWCLNTWYLLEIGMHLVAQRLEFFTNPEIRAWNFLDLVLAAMSLMDIFLEMGIGGGPSVARHLRIVRVVRILRSLRLVRWLRHLREFRKMIFALLVSIQTFFWAIILLVFLMYTFAIWFTSSVSDHIRENPGRENNTELYDYFGSMMHSMYSLWLSISGGVNWYYIVLPLFKANTELAALFISYISITVLGVMNIVTSIFVESAMRSTQHYRDLLVQEKERNKEMYAKHLRQIFNQIDIDDSGLITMDELRQFLQDESLELTAYFEALDIDAEDAKALFLLLDRDGSGEIDVEEFCDGCLRLKGEAKSFDINCLLYNSKRIESKLRAVMEGMLVIIEELDERRQPPSGLQAQLSRRSQCSKMEAIAEEPPARQLGATVGDRHHASSPSSRCFGSPPLPRPTAPTALWC